MEITQPVVQAEVVQETNTTVNPGAVNTGGGGGGILEACSVAGGLGGSGLIAVEEITTTGPAPTVTS